jgi:nucleotide-binding universal stress UspA family protein
MTSRGTARAEARENLLEIGRSLEGVEFADALAITGTSPARSLQHVSEGADAAVVVVGSTTRGPLRRIAPGTVAERLVSGAACAVAVAPHGYRDDEAAELAVIGVAFDGSQESQRALEDASELARRAGADLRVITVHQRLAFGAIPVSAQAPADSVNRVVEQELQYALAGWRPWEPRRSTPGPLYREATTMTMAGIVMAPVGAGPAWRTNRLSLRAVGPWSNRLLLVGIAVEVAMIALLAYTPARRPLPHE